MAVRGSAPSRLPLFIAVGVILIALAVGAVFYVRASGQEPRVVSQTSEYVEGVAGTWQRVNPIFANGNEVDQDLSQLVFSGLLGIGPHGSVVPDLATELPEVSPDGSTYTFHLRDDVKWHDGEDFTSEDVLFTIEAIKASGAQGAPELAATWDSVEVSAPDDHTVVVRLPEPSAPFLARNATIGILPAHLLEGLSAERLFESPFNAAPVGTGPYRLTSLSSEEAYLEANPRYHLGQPGIGAVRLRFYTDYGEAMRALERGDVEGLMIRTPASETQQQALASVEGVDIHALQRSAKLLLYLNNDAAFFQDLRVRQAIALAIDQEALANEIYGTAAQGSSSPVAPGSWAYDPSHEDLDVALDEARQLLTDAGWESETPNGIRIRLGAEFRITIRTDDDPRRVAAAQAVARQLEPLGIQATVASTSFAVLRRDFLEERRYETAIASWDQGADPDPYFAWHSSQMGSAGLNIANYSDPIADRLIEEGRRSSDPAARTDMYSQFQEVWNHSVPSVVLAYSRYIYAQATSVDSVLPGFLPKAHLRFASIHEWRRS